MTRYLRLRKVYGEFTQNPALGLQRSPSQQVKFESEPLSSVSIKYNMRMQRNIGMTQSEILVVFFGKEQDRPFLRIGLIDIPYMSLGYNFMGNSIKLFSM